MLRNSLWFNILLVINSVTEQSSFWEINRGGLGNPVYIIFQIFKFHFLLFACRNESFSHVKSFTICVWIQFTRFLLSTASIIGPGSSVGIATDYGLEGPGIESRRGDIFRRPDRPWGPPSLLYNGYRVFPGGKVRPGHAANPSPPSSAVVVEE